MDCKKIKIWLSYYLLDELDQSAKSEVEKHLEGCAECRQALEDLKYYQSVLKQVDEVKSPAGLKGRILEKVDQEQEKGIITIRKNTYYNIGRYVAVAAVLILAILLIPFIHQPAQIEITYSKKVMKKGKGGPEEKRETEEVRLIREIAELSNGEIIHVNTNEKTGLVDYIEAKIPKEDYNTFVERYNQEDLFKGLPDEAPKGISRNLNIKIYYPGRRFVTGDFNADGRDDILAHYFRGKHGGKWYLSENSADSFAVPAEISVHEILEYVPVPNQLISGDFNNDGFDDLLVGFYNNKSTTEWSFALNDKQGNFLNRHDLLLEGDSILSAGLYHAYAADINGDGADEFIVHFADGDMYDQWWCFVNMGDLSFYKPIRLPIIKLSDTLAGMSKVFFMDYNGDDRDDMLIYWKRKHDPEWWLSENQRNLQMGIPSVITRAYQGDYNPYIVDFNGDGYDEMIVKEGAENMYGEWHVWKNVKGKGFRGDGSVKFGRESSFIIRVVL